MKRDTWFDDYFDKGIAIGHSDVKSDLIHFQFKDRGKQWERFAFPTYDVLGYRGCAHFNGTWYEAKIKDLRKLGAKNKEQAHG